MDLITVQKKSDCFVYSIDYLYPVENDLDTVSAVLYPQVHNYFCLNGKQVYLRRVRNIYEVFTRGWIPSDYLHQRRKRAIFEYVLNTSRDLGIMHELFCKTCLELLTSSHSLYIS